MYGRHWFVQQFVVQVALGLQPLGKNTLFVGSLRIGSKPELVEGQIVVVPSLAWRPW